MPIYHSNRYPTDFVLTEFTPTATNSGFLTIENAAIITMKQRREVSIYLSNYDTELSTVIGIPTGLFTHVYSIQCTRNINNVSENISASLASPYTGIILDRDNSITGASPISITIIGQTYSGTIEAQNQPPTVNAGIDDSVLTGTPLSLDGTISDDGLPNPPGAVTASWSKISGPGNVVFGDDAAVDTTATFDATGTYVLRLQGSDSQLINTDNVTITVTGTLNQTEYESLASTSTFYFKLDEDTNTSIALNEVGTTGEYRNINPETASVSGIFNDTGNAITFDSSSGHIVGPLSTIGSGDCSISAYIKTTDNYGYVVSTRESFTSGNLCMFIDNTGKLQPVFAAWDGSGMGSAINDGETHHLVLTYDQSINTISGFVDTLYVGEQTPTGTSISGTPFLIGARSNILPSYSLPLGGIFDEIMMFDYALTSGNIVTLYNPVNQAPTVDAGDNASTTTGLAVSLDGTVSDDGLPSPPGLVTTTWSKISGPGNVTFGDSGVVDTTATFDSTGVYVLQLEADDSSLSTTDTVQITVNAELSGYYIHPTGNASNDGSFNSPWDLDTALSPTTNYAGETFWLRGGTYSGVHTYGDGFQADIYGESGNNAVVRSYPGELAKIDTYTSSRPGSHCYFLMNGDYVTWRDIEFFNTRPDERYALSGHDPTVAKNNEHNLFRGWIKTQATNVDMINCFVHDMIIGVLSDTANTIGGNIYGNIIYNNGFLCKLTANGNYYTRDHGIYTQNADNTPTHIRYIRDNIMFNNCGYGIQCYHGSEKISNHTMTGNIMFNAGFDDWSELKTGFNFLVQSSSTDVDNIVFNDNHTYLQDDLLNASQNDQFHAPSNSNLIFKNNYLATGKLRFRQTWDVTESTNNTVFTVSQFDGDTVTGINTIGTRVGASNKVVIQPNEYESGRGHVTIYNWEGSGSIDLDLDSILSNNASYTIHHVYDLTGTPQTGIYTTGTPVTITMGSKTSPQMLGDLNTPSGLGCVPTVQDLEFGCYLVRTLSIEN